MKRRTFLQFVIGGVAALFAGSSKAKSIDPIKNTEAKPISATEIKGIVNLLTKTSDAFFMEGDQWTDSQINRMIEQHRKTMDELCLGVIRNKV